MTNPSRYIVTAYSPLEERWHTERVSHIDAAADEAEALADRYGWADVWRAHEDLVVHYDRVHTGRRAGRRVEDKRAEAVSLATSRWYAAIATENLQLADAAWYVYSRAIGGAPGARYVARSAEAA